MKKIIKVAQQWSDLSNSKCGANLFESEVVTSLLGNFELWIGITADHKKDTQDYQNTFIRRVWQPTGMIKMESGIINIGTGCPIFWETLSF